MNIIKYIRDLFKENDYVYLVKYDGARYKFGVKKEGYFWYAKTHPNSGIYCTLLPGGKAKGLLYIGWEPITRNTKDYFNKGFI